MHLMFHAHQPILFGTLLAMIFPETATRHHPLQKETYWVQHLLIYTIPAQLMVIFIKLANLIIGYSRLVDRTKSKMKVIQFGGINCQ